MSRTDYANLPPGALAMNSNVPYGAMANIEMQAKVEAIRMGLQLRDKGQTPEDKIIELILQTERELVETYTARYLIENGTPAAEPPSHIHDSLSLAVQKRRSII